MAWMHLIGIGYVGFAAHSPWPSAAHVGKLRIFVGASFGHTLWAQLGGNEMAEDGGS